MNNLGIYADDIYDHVSIYASVNSPRVNYIDVLGTRKIAINMQFKLG